MSRGASAPLVRTQPLRAISRAVQSLQIAALVVFGFASVSCSTYRLAGSGQEQRATIAIVTLENDSVEPGVEVVVTRALRQGFLRRGSARLVSDRPRRRGSGDPAGRQRRGTARYLRETDGGTQRQVYRPLR